MTYISDHQKRRLGDDMLQLIRDNFSVDQLYDDQAIEDYIRDNPAGFRPDTMFDDDRLGEWARDNGFIERE